MRYEEKKPPRPHKKTAKSCNFALNVVKDADIIAKLEEVKASDETPSAYIRRLIRENIKYGDY